MNDDADIRNTNLVSTIQHIYPLEERLQDLILDKVEIFEYPARYKLIRQGARSRMLYFIEKGALRSYYLKDGEEVTTWFSFEHSFATSFYSFISGEPSFENIELLEDSVLLGLSFHDLNPLTEAHPSINQLYRKVLEWNFVLQEQKIAERYNLASERYQELIRKYPEILQRVPLGYIASYLGITQSTLSRIRKL